MTSRSTVDKKVSLLPVVGIENVVILVTLPKKERKEKRMKGAWKKEAEEEETGVVLLVVGVDVLDFKLNVDRLRRYILQEVKIRGKELLGVNGRDQERGFSHCQWFASEG